MKTESVYPEHWEKRTRDEVLVLIDEYIHWYNHERIKQSLGWMITPGLLRILVEA